MNEKNSFNNNILWQKKCKTDSMSCDNSDNVCQDIQN